MILIVIWLLALITFCSKLPIFKKILLATLLMFQIGNNRKHRNKFYDLDAFSFSFISVLQ